MKEETMPGAGPTAELQVSYEILSEVYLAMWRLLDRISDENRWLEIRPVDAAVLQDDIRQTVESLCLDPSSTLFSDYQQTQEFLSPHRSSGNIDLAGFREYLRDTGLRLAERAAATAD
jgi:hypothetical protein